MFDKIVGLKQNTELKNTTVKLKALTVTGSKFPFGLDEFPIGRKIQKLIHDSSRVLTNGWHALIPGDKHYDLMVELCSAILGSLPLQNELGESHFRRDDNDEMFWLAEMSDLIENMKYLGRHKGSLNALYMDWVNIHKSLDDDPSGKETQKLLQSWLDSIEEVPFTFTTKDKITRWLGRFHKLQEHMDHNPGSRITTGLNNFLTNLPDTSINPNELSVLIKKYLPFELDHNDADFLAREHYKVFLSKISAPVYGLEQVKNVFNKELALRKFIDIKARKAMDEIAKELFDYGRSRWGIIWEQDDDSGLFKSMDEIKSTVELFCSFSNRDILEMHKSFLEGMKADKEWFLKMQYEMIIEKSFHYEDQTDDNARVHRILQDFILKPEISQFHNVLEISDGDCRYDRWIFRNIVNEHKGIPRGIEFDIKLRHGSGNSDYLRANAMVLNLHMVDNERADLMGDAIEFLDVSFSLYLNGAIEIKTYLNEYEYLDDYYDQKGNERISKQNGPGAIKKDLETNKLSSPKIKKGG